jgi:hypothetical protein
MTCISGANIVENGLVLCLDAANIKSYSGSGTVWKDLSGNGNDGTLVNGVGYSSDNNGAMVFDGSNDYVNITNQIQFERTDSFTISAWIRSNNSNNNQIVNNENSSYRGYQFAINSSGNLIFFLRNTVSTNFIGTITIEEILPNKWHFLLVTYDGSSNANGVNLYANGLLMPKNIVGNNLTQTTISDNTTWIGKRSAVSNGPFNGYIPNVQIYNRALTEAEIQQNFEATRGRYGI